MKRFLKWLFKNELAQLEYELHQEILDDYNAKLKDMEDYIVAKVGEYLVFKGIDKPVS